MDRLFDRLMLNEAGCWIWTGVVNGYGYGMIRKTIDGRLRTLSPHRVAYEHFRGPIPVGLTIDHLCRVRHCANPWHMEVVTSRENTLRGVGLTAQNARKTHCSRGHEFSEENTLIRRRDNGRLFRNCRICKRMNEKVLYYQNPDHGIVRAWYGNPLEEER